MLSEAAREYNLTNIWDNPRLKDNLNFSILLSFFLTLSAYYRGNVGSLNLFYLTRVLGKPLKRVCLHTLTTLTYSPVCRLPTSAPPSLYLRPSHFSSRLFSFFGVRDSSFEWATFDIFSMIASLRGHKRRKWINHD